MAVIEEEIKDIHVADEARRRIERGSI